MSKKYSLRAVASMLVGVTLASCSNSGGNASSGNNSNNNGNVNSLQIITPKTIYSSPAAPGTGYVVINNPSSRLLRLRWLVR